MTDSGGPWVTLDLLAQIWMERKSNSRAAQLLACADRIFELHGWVRKPYASRRRASLLVLLAEALTADELARLQQAGASMSVEEAIALGMSF